MQQIIVYTIYFLSIFIPLVFTTINYELFEFPKFIILLSGTLIITLAWVVHIFSTRDYQIIRAKNISPLHIGILAILITQTISTLFSISPYTSFWGYYSRFHQGLLTTICYTIIYFTAIRWMDNKSTQKLIKITVGTSFIVSLYAILEHFGIDKNLWVQDVQSRVFSTIGQPNWLAAYLIPNIFLTFYLSHTNKNPNSRIIHYSLFIILFMALLFTKSRSGLLAFGVAYITYWALMLRQFSFAKIKQSILIYSGLTLFIFMILRPPVAIPTTSNQIGTTLENGGTESGDIRKIVWTGAIDLIKKYPLLGTGPETFAYTYYWTRPAAHNMTSEWDFLYNKAHNEYLNIGATTGIVGLLAYLYFHLAIFTAGCTIVPKTKKVNEDQEDAVRYLYPVLGASIVAFATSNFFGFSVIPVYLLMITIAILPFTIINKPEIPTHIPPIYLSVLFVLIYPIALFLADYSYNQGKRYFDAGQLANALPLLEQAVSIRPGLDLYHATLAETYAGLGQKDRALKELDATRRLNPYHLNLYKSRAKIYLTLSLNESAAKELEQARALAPTDPKLAYNLGLIYTRLDKAESAIIQLQDAAKLKPNYVEPYYALTLLYEQTKQLDKIAPLLTSARTNLATYSAQLKDKIDKYTTP